MPFPYARIQIKVRRASLSTLKYRGRQETWRFCGDYYDNNQKVFEFRRKRTNKDSHSVKGGKRLHLTCVICVGLHVTIIKKFVLDPNTTHTCFEIIKMSINIMVHWLLNTIFGVWLHWKHSIYNFYSFDLITNLLAIVNTVIMIILIIESAPCIWQSNFESFTMREL